MVARRFEHLRGTTRAVVLFAAISPIVATVAASPGATHEASASTPPNVVFILTDDMRLDQLERMPIVQSELVDKGVTFDDAFITNPLCCPSRTSILRGQYSHTTGIYQNTPPAGGYPTFHDAGEESSTLATWLDGAGYRTGLVGKYLNKYGPGNTAIPPGWDRWVALDEENQAVYDYDVNIDGTIQHFGTTASDYAATVWTSFGEDFIRSTPTDTPLFLYLAYNAPHAPYTAAPDHTADPRCSDVTNADSPSFNEADVSDKPAEIRAIPPLSSSAQKSLGTSLPRVQCRMLLSADDGVGRILTALADTGRLADTLIVFVSDNGAYLGEHRLNGKSEIYEEDVHVPMLIRYDAITSGAPTHDEHLVMNVDLAPTVVDLLGLDVAPGCPTPPYKGTCSGGFDGRSLVPILDGSVTDWRNEILLENKPWCAVRTDRYVFGRQSTGEEELYDLQTDPFELTNMLYGTISPETQALRDSLFAAERLVNGADRHRLHAEHRAGRYRRRDHGDGPHGRDGGPVRRFGRDLLGRVADVDQGDGSGRCERRADHCRNAERNRVLELSVHRDDGRERPDGPSRGLRVLAGDDLDAVRRLRPMVLRRAERAHGDGFGATRPVVHAAVRLGHPGQWWLVRVHVRRSRTVRLLVHRLRTLSDDRDRLGPADGHADVRHGHLIIRRQMVFDRDRGLRVQRPVPVPPSGVDELGILAHPAVSHDLNGNDLRPRPGPRHLSVPSIITEQLHGPVVTLLGRGDDLRDVAPDGRRTPPCRPPWKESSMAPTGPDVERWSENGREDRSRPTILEPPSTRFGLITGTRLWTRLLALERRGGAASRPVNRSDPSGCASAVHPVPCSPYPYDRGRPRRPAEAATTAGGERPRWRRRRCSPPSSSRSALVRPPRLPPSGPRSANTA
jgi:arylsulfatase A-like enzyme